MEFMLDIGEIILRSVISVTVLFVLAKLMGSKQISQLTFFDYVIGISIGSIAAEMSANDELPFHFPLIAMMVYAVIAIAISVATNKSIRIRRFMNGTPSILIDRGRILRENLKHEKIDLNELLGQCRGQGYFNLADIDFAILETNGKLSILPRSRKRPVTPEDLNLTPPEEGLCANVVIDGQVMEKHLKAVGKNREWLERQMKSQGIKSLNDIILATCDTNGNFSAYLKNKTSPKNLFD